MPIKQTKISLSPQRMQEEEARRKEQALLSGFESRLTKTEFDGIRRGVQQGIRDIEEGRSEEFDADGLRNLGTRLVATSVRKLSGRHQAR